LDTVNGPTPPPRFCSVLAAVRSIALSVGKENGVASTRGALSGIA
jgi:hypothetical protein